MHRTESLYYGIGAKLALNQPVFRFLSIAPGLVGETEALSPSIAWKASESETNRLSVVR